MLIVLSFVSYCSFPLYSSTLWKQSWVLSLNLLFIHSWFFFFHSCSLFSESFFPIASNYCFLDTRFLNVFFEVSSVSWIVSISLTSLFFFLDLNPVSAGCKQSCWLKGFPKSWMSNEVLCLLGDHQMSVTEGIYSWVVQIILGNFLVPCLWVKDWMTAFWEAINGKVVMVK